jgi:hypothetical protein
MYRSHNPEDGLSPTLHHQVEQPVDPPAEGYPHSPPNDLHTLPLCPACRQAEVEGALPVEALFAPLPPDNVSSGYLQLGDDYNQETEVELCLGPDGQVWARVGALEQVPLLPLEERERLARRILDEFLKAYADWGQGRPRPHPTARTLCSWPAWQLTAWLHEAAQTAPPVLARLMQGVLGEIQALGFRTKPEGG